MSEEQVPQFPNHQPPRPPLAYAHPKQSGPLLKLMRHMLKTPPKKLLQTRNKTRTTRAKKYRVI